MHRLGKEFGAEQICRLARMNVLMASTTAETRVRPVQPASAPRGLTKLQQALPAGLVPGQPVVTSNGNVIYKRLLADHQRAAAKMT